MTSPGSGGLGASSNSTSISPACRSSIRCAGSSWCICRLHLGAFDEAAHDRPGEGMEARREAEDDAALGAHVGAEHRLGLLRRAHGDAGLLVEDVPAAVSATPRG